MFAFQKSPFVQGQRRPRDPIGVLLTAGLLTLAVFSGAARGQEPQRQAPLVDANTANLPAHRIGNNDLIAISVYASPELTRTLRVGMDGLIRLPLLKEPVKAAGRMPAELEAAIQEALKSAELIVDPQVTVTVVEYQSRPISVMGAVRKPVTFQAAGKLSLLEALARAEGLAADAGPEILVTRTSTDPDAAPSLVRRIPVKALLGATDPSLNLELSGGEEVRIPAAEKIFVVGNVRRPGAFGVGEEAGTTVLKAVAMAEGLAPYAAKQAVIYRREATGSMNELTVELGKIMGRKAPDSPLLPNDVLYIPEARGKKLGWATVERLLLFGSGATTALIYGTTVH